MGLACLAMEAASAPPSTPEQAWELHHRRLGEAERRFVAQQEALAASYRLALDQMDERARAQGDLDLVLAVRREMDGAAPTASETGAAAREFTELDRLRSEYLGQREQRQIDHARQLILFTRQYLDYLEKLSEQGEEVALWARRAAELKSYAGALALVDAVDRPPASSPGRTEARAQQAVPPFGFTAADSDYLGAMVNQLCGALAVGSEEAAARLPVAGVKGDGKALLFALQSKLPLLSLGLREGHRPQFGEWKVDEAGRSVSVPLRIRVRDAVRDAGSIRWLRPQSEWLMDLR